MPQFDPKIPHNELPELPPAAELIETTEILKKCINARVALAELKQAAKADTELIASHGGVFEITVDGDLVFSKKGLGRHADPGEVVGLIDARAG